MNINLITLNTKGKVEFSINPDLKEYYNNDVKDIKDLLVEGYILDNGTDDYEVNLHITGNIILKSAINNSDVSKKIDIKYNDFITDLVKNYKNSSNTLDILPIIWENILLEIPMRAVNEGDEFEVTSGEGWEINLD